MLTDRQQHAAWEHFQHGADVGIRGMGATRAQAFEQAALALTAVITPPEAVRDKDRIAIRCHAADDDFLFLDWVNAVIYEMAIRNMLFGRFDVRIHGTALDASAWGEPVNVSRHAPAVEPKGATFTELAVKQAGDGSWIAQCVVDV